MTGYYQDLHDKYYKRTEKTMPKKPYQACEHWTTELTKWLSDRLAIVLGENGIRSRVDLAGRTLTELYRFHGFGHMAFQELTFAFHDMGMYWDKSGTIMSYPDPNVPKLGIIEGALKARFEQEQRKNELYKQNHLNAMLQQARAKTETNELEKGQA